MSDSSSEEVFFDTHESIIPSAKSQQSVSGDDLPKPRIENHLYYKNRLSLNSDYISSSSSTKNDKKYHNRTSSITFEEHQHGKPPHSTLTASYQKHTRVHSWSESSYRSASPFSSIGRRSHDSNRTSLLVGVHNQYHPASQKTPPHEKPYVKIKTKIKTNKRFSRIVLAQTLAVDTTEVYATTGLKIEDKGAEDSKQPMGAIWVSRFSKDGKYMATGGQTCVVNVWKVLRDLQRSNDVQVQDILPHEPSIKVFHDAPVQTYVGHTADVLDISWSKNNFLISSSMDKTVRLWHISQKVCLCVFRHMDVVTSAKFHPKDDRFFLSGSFDCKVRLWSIPEKRVAFWNDIPAGNMITAVGFTSDGRTACVGANTGDVFFFETQGLKYNTQILVKNHRHKRGKKVTGIEPMPGMPLGEERILVTTNDSRIWIINMKDKSFVYKYKGIENPTLQLRASFSDDGRYIICGSEDGCVYLWCTDQVSYSPFQHWQDSRLKAAVALGHLGDQMLQTAMQNGNFSDDQQSGLSGWLKRGERRMIDKLRSRNEHFTAHQHVVTAAIFAPTKTRQLLAKAGGDIIFDNTPVYTHREPHSDIDTDDSSLGYFDTLSEPRRNQAPSQVTSVQNAYEQEQDIDELRRILMNEFEEATQEERDRFDYPDSQIIISADLHGAIKVWRMDSGFYPNETDQELLNEEGNIVINDGGDALAAMISLCNKVENGETYNNNTPRKKGPFANFIARFK
ncbi:WD40-repeat-containing domain protein [Parasitella parasitica]|nr:WD40-repeat-containing domain protein [Parasitella parasitica]